MPTEEQLQSRKRLAEFVQAVGKPLRGLTGTLKSAWFGRPDDELKGWIDRGWALSEIEGSLGYRLIIETVDNEIIWSQQQLEVCDKAAVDELRLYLRALRFIHHFILTTNKNADIATGVLAGRESAIGIDSATFVKNARNET